MLSHGSVISIIIDVLINQISLPPISIQTHTNTHIHTQMGVIMCTDLVKCSSSGVSYQFCYRSPVIIAVITAVIDIVIDSMIVVNKNDCR